MNIDFLANPFIITSKPLIKNYDEFNMSQTLNSAYIYWNKKTDIHQYHKKGFSIYIIGYILDINNGDLNVDEISKKIYNELVSSYDEFLDYIDCLNGRYIIVIDYDNDTRIYTDATSLRPIYYYNKSFFASHEVVVKEVVTAELNIHFNKIGGNNGYLDYTSYESIYKFIPNLYFTFNDKDFVRFFPRKDYNATSLDELIPQTNSYFKEQVKWLNKNYKKIYLSLTGGIDSKFSLAITKVLKQKIEYFTYMIDLENTVEGERKRIYAIDNDLVKILSYNLDLNHKTFLLRDYLPPNNYRNQLKHHISSHHSLALSYLFHREFDSNAIHLKSTINEVAKMPFPELMDKTEDLERLYKYSIRWQVKSLKRKPKLGKKMFYEYLERVKFDKEILHNFNLPLLLYLESRMGNWHSNITLETDNTMETFILVNSRRILNSISYLPKEERKNKEFLFETINEFWPILNYFLPNSKKTLKDLSSYNNSVSYFNDKVRITDFHNIILRNDNGKIYVQPNDSIDLMSDLVNFRIKNQSNQSLQLKFESNYSLNQKNIFVKINQKNYWLNEFKNGITFQLDKQEILEVTYSFSKNLKDSALLDAKKLGISIINN